MKILVVNGPNLNLLGIREPDIYGKNSLKDLEELIRNHATDRRVSIETFQSNHEGAIIDRLQEAFFDRVDGIVINPAGYTHTSVAIADAIKGISIPTVEVHISRVDEREPFRKISYVRDVAVKTISGKGFDGYLEGIDYLIQLIEDGKHHES